MKNKISLYTLLNYFLFGLLGFVLSQCGHSVITKEYWTIVVIVLAIHFNSKK